MSTVYLIPTFLHVDGIISIPSYIIPIIKECDIFFVENERTTRRYFKQLLRQQLPAEDMIIDSYEWVNLDNQQIAESIFENKLAAGKKIGIVSEAGCPGVADPGQQLVAIAQEQNVAVIPLVGPSSILLALMASGMNGQQFAFNGYLPIESQQRIKAIKELEINSIKNNNSTQIFIETPYRNNQLVETLIKHCRQNTKICIAVDLTAPTEWIRTKTIATWGKNVPDIHKRLALFLLQAY